MSYKVEIMYCTQCRWLMRSAWMAQELLTTFTDEISALSLIPSTGGKFQVIADGKIVWCRKEQGRFPDITELKQLVRDIISPDRHLGHSDKRPPSNVD
ncbi:SelT/SelW/SelH family protein [Planctobacterium marinum]|uniref:SelT/SelW/SelH family protein n=1 Tax=Planctobacterium marinum TaxID=1631968 RepID=UPI001E491259|nr:SelT/SelW/SelH family protein [Planctobacterium marinum]MCC2604380.1 SelT/SelW/SelH family protein [Planctobacterium marinum]